MAFLTSFLVCICFFIVMDPKVIGVNNDVGILSQLNNVQGQRQPVIVVVGENLLKSHHHHRSPPPETSSEERLVNRLVQILSNAKHRNVHSHNVPLASSTPRYVYTTKRPTLDEKVNALRSPVLKSLLRISNTIQCSAQDKCKKQCDTKKKKKYTCVDECQKKYVCEEVEEDKSRDDCDDCKPDSCGNEDECESSTRGVTLEPSDNECKRC